MGPIEKKIDSLVKEHPHSIETLELLINLQEEVSDIEKHMVNEAYYRGFSDKERNRGLSWDYFKKKYPNTNQLKK